MDFNHDSSSSNGLETSMNTTNGDNKIHHRHSIHQIQKLEAYFKECPHPDDTQRHKLAEELKLKPKQIKFWFQNKRTQAKVQIEKTVNASLKAENMKIRHENEVMQEALKTVTCPPCGGPRLRREERGLDIQKLRAHNAYLKEQLEQISDLVNNNGGHSIPSINSLAYRHGPSLYASASSNPHVYYGTSSNHPVEPPSFEREPYTREHINIAQSTQHFQPPSQMEKMMMSETMASAVTEIIRLIHTEEPMWIKSSIDDRLVIDQEKYEKSFTKISHLKCPSARIESSKEVVVVPMDARNLVDVLFDTEKWARLFATIVNEAKTIQVLSMDTQKQSFSQLMYEQLHILSPLVPPREFMILRCCQQVEADLWVIADVSYHHVNVDLESLTCSKRPSGCLIQALPNGFSKVTWMEHVEVNDKVRNHRIYRDLLYGGFGYGARRWTVTLERMCERLSLSSISVLPTTNDAGVVKTVEGRRSVLDLGERMLKTFASILNMSGNYDFSQLSENNSSGVTVSVRVNSETGQPMGLIVCAASSLCLPLSPLQVYNFLTNIEIRHQWDILCLGNPAAEVTGFVTGTDHKNRVNILQPTSSTENAGIMIIQESFIDALGGMVVYAPVDVNTANAAVSGQVNPSGIPVLPSGFILSRDGYYSTSPKLEDGRDYSRTLLTVAFQILVSGAPLSGDHQIEESTTSINTLITSTLQKIKTMLNCNEGK